jgi:hypothetical protein
MRRRFCCSLGVTRNSTRDAIPITDVLAVVRCSQRHLWIPGYQGPQVFGGCRGRPARLPAGAVAAFTKAKGSPCSLTFA